MEQEIRLSPAGARAAGVWLAGAGAALGGGLALFSPAGAGAFLGAWGLLCLGFVWGWCPTARLLCRGGGLLFTAGRVFPLSLRLPLASVSGFAVVSSPLMRRAGCCLLAVFAAGGPVLVLPGVPREAAARLAALLGEEGRAWS